VAVGPDAGDRRGDQHSDRHRRQLDAGGDRVVSLGPLVIEDEDEHQREAGEAVDEGGAAGGGEEAVAEDREVEHRRRAAVLDQHEERQQDRRDEERADHQTVVPARDAAARDPVDESGEADHEGQGAGEVEAADGVALGELAQRVGGPGAAQQGKRHVEPEDPLPGDRDQGAAEHRADHQPDRGDHRVGAHRQPELLAGEGIGDEGGAVGEDEGAADPLQDPPEDQLGAVGGEAGAERGGGEDREGRDEGILAPEQVGEPAGGQDQHGRGDHVGEDHPDQFEQARAERPLEVGEGDDQRPRVGRDEQHPEAGAGESPPLVVLVTRVDAAPEKTLPYVHVNYSTEPETEFQAPRRRGPAAATRRREDRSVRAR
jgi:hypothetical protein